MMIFYQFRMKLLDNIELIVEYYSENIRIHVQWSSTRENHWILSYIDDECTLPMCETIDSHLVYLCSSSLQNQKSLKTTFYPYWFAIDSSLFRRLFAHIVNDEEHFLLLLSLPDGRILALPESPNINEHFPYIWHCSASANPVIIIGIHYDSTTNLVDAVLAASANRPSLFPTSSSLVINHLICCEHVGTLLIFAMNFVRRLLLDNSIHHACIYSNNFIFITSKEIRYISLAILLKPSKDEMMDQTKILRIGHFEKLIVDGQEIVIHHRSGTFERLNNLLPRSNSLPSIISNNTSKDARLRTIAIQAKKLTCLTSTITSLQSSAAQLQRTLNKVQIFHQLDLNQSLKQTNNDWKLILTDQQLRILQPNDLVLVLICRLSSNEVHISQMTPTIHWSFKSISFPSTFICQPILFLKQQQHQIDCRIGSARVIVPLQEIHHDGEDTTIETLFQRYFPAKFKRMINANTTSQHHLALTIRNDAAWNFKKLNINLARRLLMGRIEIVNIECKQQEMKVDTDAGLVDAVTLQIILSSACLRRLIVAFSALSEMLFGNKTTEEKSFVKQVDVIRVLDLMRETQNTLQNNPQQLSDESLLNLLQIRICLAMFRLGTNYTVQVY